MRSRSAARAVVAAGGLLVLALLAGPASAGPYTGTEVPILVSPAPGASSVDAPLLTWQPSAGAVEYAVQIWSTSAFTGGTIRADGGTTQTSFIPTLLGPGTWWWRVQALDVNGRFGFLSETRSFRILPSLGASPILSAPASGSTFTYPTSLPILRWQPVAAATAYDIELASTATFAAPTAVHRSTLPAFAAPTDNFGATMYWRVRAVRALGINPEHLREVGPWSSARSYRLDWPEVPQAISPPDGATVSSLTVVWAPVAGAAGYDVQWTTADDTTFTNATTVYRTEPHWWISAADGAAIRWRVRANLGNLPGLGATAWSVPRVATIDPAGDAPATPESPLLPQVELSGPADGATVTTVADVPLAWTPIAGAIGYQLQWAPDAIEFEPVSPQSGMHAPQLLVSIDAEAGMTYKWRVRAIGGDVSSSGNRGAGPWSEVRRLTVADAEGPTLIGPAEGSTVPAGSAIFSWTGSATAPFHTVQFSRTADFADPMNRVVLGLRTNLRLRDGLWYWRVASMGYPAIATSATGTVTIADTDPPVGSMSVNFGATEVPIDATSVRVDTTQEDVLGSPAEVRLSWDGENWMTYPVTARIWSTSVPIGTPETGGTTPGRRDLRISWVDEKGNASEPISAPVWYGVDAPDVPEAPTRVTAAPGNGVAVVSWSAPANDGGAPIESYEVFSSSGNAGCFTSGALSCTVPGLTNGSVHSFTVRARNAAGPGRISDSSALVIPRPTALIKPLATYQSSTSFRVSWGAEPGPNPMVGYDVRYRRAAWNGAFGSLTTWRTSTTATSATFVPLKGSTYCFSARARESTGVLSAWTPETCTAVPLDDRSVTRSSSWAARTGSAYFAGTNVRTSQAGATLTRTGVVARRIALLATTCPGCGTVRVYWQGSLIKTISLDTPTVVHRRLITVASFPLTRVGTLVIRVSSSSKWVIVDGVAIRRN